MNPPPPIRKHKQSGAVTMEFAAMLMVFFILFYGLVGYSVPLLLSASYQQLAGEGLREAVRHSSIYAVDAHQADSLIKYQQSVARIVNDSWLPAKWAQTCSDYPAQFLKVEDNVWSVCISNPEVQNILPAFKIFDWHIPSLPEEIKGEAKLRLR